MLTEKFRELLAKYAHVAWSGWMQYLFSKSRLQSDGTLIIPKELVARWATQTVLPYEALPEEMKKSDREQADKLWDIFYECFGEDNGNE